MIPHVFHQYWSGPSLPEGYKAFREGWRRLHPDWEFFLWGEELELPELINQDLFDRAEELYPKHPWQFRADILRYELLHEYGGVWLDVDFECLRSIEPLLSGVECFAAWEKQDELINNAILGAAPGHPFMRGLIDALPGVVKDNPKAAVWQVSGPRLVTNAAKEWAGKRALIIFPEAWFYPVRVNQLERLKQPHPEAYAVHWWNSLNKEKPKRKAQQYQDLWRDGQCVVKGERTCSERYQAIRDLLERELGRGFSVLDIGGWDGYFTTRLQEDLNAKVTNVDERWSDDPGHVRARVTAENIEQFGNYDVILMLSVLHHMEDWEEVYRKARRQCLLLIVEVCHPDEAKGKVSDVLQRTGYRLAPQHERIMADAAEVICESPPIDRPKLRRPTVLIRQGARGTVETGTQQASALMELTAPAEWRQLGYEPYPGTLNVRVTDAARRWFEGLPGVIAPDLRTSEHYVPVIIEGINGHLHFSRQDVGRDTRPVEVASASHLRTVLGLTDGDRVDIRGRVHGVSVAIMAHPERRQWAEELHARFGGTLFFDPGDGLIANARQSLAAYDPLASYHLVLQDDAIPAVDLIAALERCIPVVGRAPICLYTTGRKNTTWGDRIRDRARDRAHDALSAGASWIRDWGPTWAVCVAHPVELLPAVLKRFDAQSTRSDDVRLTEAYKAMGIPCWHSVPSLCDHRLSPTIHWRGTVLQPDRWAGAFLSDAGRFNPAGSVYADSPVVLPRKPRTKGRGATYRRV